MRFAEVVAASAAVAATPARSRKVAVLEELLRALRDPEAGIAVAMLTGSPRQGRIGVGWRTLYDLEVVPAPEPSLTIVEIDRAIDELAACVGSGSNGERTRILTGLLGRATVDEQAFVRRLLTGELRQGALEGVMTDAVARAAGVPPALVRRAAMLRGDLAATAITALTEGGTGLGAMRLEVGRAVQPMLAATSPDATSAIAEVGSPGTELEFAL